MSYQQQGYQNPPPPYHGQPTYQSQPVVTTTERVYVVRDDEAAIRDAEDATCLACLGATMCAILCCCFAGGR
eukprot:m.306803 g.306803  ORF g.306803 m.306803 type:complete len:72 (+) comp41597_c0_seq1:438-653(+)